MSYNNGTDAFVAKVKANGTGLAYCGYIGGSSTESGFRIAVDSGGAALVTGQTASDESSFPVTSAEDPTFNGGGFDAFVAKVKANGTALTYAGYIGGSENEVGGGIAVDASGNAYVTGFTSSSESSDIPFPVFGGPDLTYNGAGDAFAAKLGQNGIVLNAGYIGGSGYDSAIGVAVDGAGAAYIAGIASDYSSGSDSTFPRIIGPDLTHNGGADTFVVKVASNLLRNGDFDVENTDDNSPDYWTTNPHFTRTSEPTFSEPYAGQHEATDNAAYIIKQLVSRGIVGGKKYYFDGYVNIPETGDSFGFRLQIRWLDANKALISVGALALLQAQTSGWLRVSQNLTAPSGAKRAEIRMQVTSLSAVIYVDRFVLSRR